MLVLAKSIKGKEFIYNARSAHKVSKKSAEKIRDTLNRLKYKLNDGETWYIHELGYYDGGTAYAETQQFTIYKNTIREKYL